MPFYRSLLALMAMVVIGCTDQPPVNLATATPQPKWMTEQPTTTVEPSPQVKALLKDDPDIRELSEAEIKAALAAAQGSSPRPSPVGAARGPDGDLSKLESEQKSHNLKRIENGCKRNHRRAGA